jgi:hypothetical protein
VRARRRAARRRAAAAPPARRLKYYHQDGAAPAIFPPNDEARPQFASAKNHGADRDSALDVIRFVDRILSRGIRPN